MGSILLLKASATWVNNNSLTCCKPYSCKTTIQRWCPNRPFQTSLSWIKWFMLLREPNRMSYSVKDRYLRTIPCQNLITAISQTMIYFRLRKVKERSLPRITVQNCHPSWQLHLSRSLIPTPTRTISSLKTLSSALWAFLSKTSKTCSIQRPTAKKS